MKRDSLKFSMLALPLFRLIAVIGLILPLPATMESERHNGARPAPTPPEPLPPQNSNRPSYSQRRHTPSRPASRRIVSGFVKGWSQVARTPSHQTSYRTPIATTIFALRFSCLILTDKPSGLVPNVFNQWWKREL